MSNLKNVRIVFAENSRFPQLEFFSAVYAVPKVANFRSRLWAVLSKVRIVSEIRVRQGRGVIGLGSEGSALLQEVLSGNLWVPNRTIPTPVNW